MFNEMVPDFEGGKEAVFGNGDASLTAASENSIDVRTGAVAGPGFVTETQRAVAVLAEIDRLLDGLPVGLEGVEALESGVFERALRVADRAQAVLAVAAARVDAGGGWAADGSRCCAGYLARAHQIAFHRAKALCSTGALLRDVLPATSRQAQAGSLGWDIALDMAKATTTSPARRDALNMLVEAEDTRPLARNVGEAGDEDRPVGGDGSKDPADGLDEIEAPLIRGEEWLLAQSYLVSERQFRGLVKSWAHRVDPDADERGFREASDREQVVLVQTLDCFHLQGQLTIEHGKILQTALKAIIGVPNAGDSRTGAQRMANALVDLARINIEQVLEATASGVRPHLTVTIPYETFQALAVGVGQDGGQLDALAGTEAATWTEDAGPVPNSLLARLACDSTIARVVFGPTGEVINAGRSRRVISAAARTAVIARDRHCVYPRCDAPPGLCEAHHIRHWSDGGRTDLNNLALICWHHHQQVHSRELTITREPGPHATSQWRFTTPDGQHIE